MMPLTVMLRITEELDGKRMPAPVVTAVRRWKGDADSVRYVRSSANHIFRFERDGALYYLRLSPASERAPARLAAELDFVEAVARAGVPVARPIPSLEGKLIERIEPADERYYAVLFAGLQGEGWLEPDALSPAMYRAWGRTLGRIHRVSQMYEPADVRFPSWRERVKEALPWLEKEPAIQSALIQAASWLERLPRPAGSQGVIHGDPELDNLVWDGATFHTMDFDDAHTHFYAYDVALALEAVGTDSAEAAERMGWFLEGYEMLAEMPVVDPDLIPRFLRLNQAFKAARLVRAYAGLPQAGVPAWVERLRARHGRALAETRAAMAAPFVW